MSIDKTSSSLAICSMLDDSYVIGLTTLLVSIHENTPKKINLDLLIIDLGISDRNKLLISQLWTGNVRFYTCSNKLEQKTARSPKEAVSYNKLLIFELTSLYERLLYLDADVLVFCDINELLEKPFSEDICLAHDQHHLYPSMYNAGVMILNNSAGRQYPLVLKHLQTRNHWEFADQSCISDCINMGYLRVRMLEPEYNVKYRPFALEKMGSGVYKKMILEGTYRIVHFMNIKPWQPDFPTHDPFASYYR